MDMIESDVLPDRATIRGKLREMNLRMEEYLYEASELSEYYKLYGEVDKLAKMQFEIDRAESDYELVERNAQSFL